MDRIRIVGGRRLEGSIPISGAKNATLPLMIASMLTDQTLILDNVPRLADVGLLRLRAAAEQKLVCEHVHLRVEDGLARHADRRGRGPSARSRRRRRLRTCLGHARHGTDRACDRAGKRLTLRRPEADS